MYINSDFSGKAIARISIKQDRKLNITKIYRKRFS